MIMLIFTQNKFLFTQVTDLRYCFMLRYTSTPEGNIIPFFSTTTSSTSTNNK